LKNNNGLKTEHEKQEVEILSLKQLVVNYQKINKCLRTNIKNVQNDLNLKNALLIKSEKQMAKKVKMLSLNKSKRIENKVKKLLSSMFSPNQLNLIMKKKESELVER